MWRFCLILAFLVGLAHPLTAQTSATGVKKAETAAKGQIPINDIAEIVFIDMKDACPCTKKKIDAGWKTLNDHLAFLKAKIKITRIHADVDDASADAWWDQRSFTELPALYFLDNKEKIIDFHSGEFDKSRLEEMFR